MEVVPMFEYTFMQNAFIVSLLISLLCPLIGIFLVLRRYSMIGDALSHASLAGVAMGLLLKSTPIMGAFWMTSFFGLLIEALRERFRRYAELTLVIVMSFSVGLAITLVSSGLVKANIDSFLFGSILTVGREEVYLVGALTFVSVLAVWGLYPQLVMLSFDEDGARISGVPRRAINYVFSLLVAATISVSIRIVGILVISSLIALPVATALQLRQGFNRTLLLSVLFSFIDIMGGLVISYELGAAPGGITAILSVILLVAVLIYQEIQDHLQGGERR
ncbi:manganese/zinc/iron chelate uptake ABC transporter [Acidaminococcus intestini RyC-MR95]|jgi:zinc transport system permease protein|uniref:Manganese/zinc/iron chelate uptake ABC transporter n=3 Tax=Bacillota TaxID=1239 RepID=G4Q6M7_ACIIR|nr:manganese/zinc/iron chelate uptake ABC transporter [Acidaminococcus intestini RyC-MR95]